MWVRDTSSPSCARALACGAVRAHAVDARDGFARDVLVPSLFTSSQPTHRGHRSPGCRGRSSRERSPRSRVSKAPARSRMARPTRHSTHVFMRSIHRSPSSPRREWTMNDADLIEHARAPSSAAPGTRHAGCRIDQNMWAGRSHGKATTSHRPFERHAREAECMNQHWWTFISSAACQPP